jgi:uncharacterized protein (DUF2062 family)
MGIVPLWGFQLAIAIAGAFLFRLNKLLVIVAANISIPPMIPVILFLSYLTGGLWMGGAAGHISFSNDITLEVLSKNFLQYIIGAVTLATIAGIAFGGITFVLLKIFKRTNNQA